MDEEDLANLLSDDDLINSEQDQSADFEFVSFDSDKESDVGDTEWDDPFKLDTDQSLSDDTAESDNANNDQNSVHPSFTNSEFNSIDLDSSESEAEPQTTTENERSIDWDAIHPWPSPEEDRFVKRVIMVSHLQISIDESKIMELLFYDVPSHLHPLDIRLSHNRYYLSDKMRILQKCRRRHEFLNKYGFAEMIFRDAQTVEMMMPFLKQKEDLHHKRSRFRIYRKIKLLDIVTDHSIHRNLKDLTLRLVFIDLHWKCKALHVYHFIRDCLNAIKSKKYKINGIPAEEALNGIIDGTYSDIEAMMPIKIQIIEDEKGYVAHCAFVDFANPQIASKVLFACHGRQLLGRTVFVDWHPFPERVETWMQIQDELKETQNCQTLLIHNLHKHVTSDVIRQLINKHLDKLKGTQNGLECSSSSSSSSCDVVIGDIQLVHCRRDDMLNGYCFVSFYNRNDLNNHDGTKGVFPVLEALRKRIQYKILEHRSIVVTWTSNLKYYAFLCQQNSQNLKSLPKTTKLRDRTRFVMLDNLVWNVQDKDLRDLLKPILSDLVTLTTNLVENSQKPQDTWTHDQMGIVINSTHIVRDTNGYPVHKALIKCTSPEVATQIVLRIDGKECRGRRVVTDWSNVDEYKRQLSAYHNVSFMSIMEFSSRFSAPRMVTFNAQLFGELKFESGKLAALKMRTRSKKKLPPNYAARGRWTSESRARRDVKWLDLRREKWKNDDIARKYNEQMKRKYEARRHVKGLGKKWAVDRRMLGMMKAGYTREYAGTRTKGQLKYAEWAKRGNNAWTRIGMSKTEFFRLRNATSWKSGRNALSEKIAKMSKIHRIDRWVDTLKYSRRRTRNDRYFQSKDKTRYREKGAASRKMRPGTRARTQNWK